MIDKTYPVTEILIRNAVISAEQLCQTLKDEATALKNTEAAELIIALAAQKRELILKLEQINGQLTQVLASERLNNDQAGMDEYFNRAQQLGLQVTESTSNWRHLMSQCEQCRSLNEQNGARIDMLLRHTQRSLDILKGQPESISVYGANGKTQSARYTRTLISV